MSVEDGSLSPVPLPTKPIEEGGGNRGRFEKTWSRWFIELRDKVNVINAILVNFANLSGTGFPALDGDQWNIRQFVAGSGIDILNPNGQAGDPEWSLDNPQDGQIYGRQNTNWIVVPGSVNPLPRIMSAASLRP